jgi:hypothetical protein
VAFCGFGGLIGVSIEVESRLEYLFLFTRGLGRTSVCLTEIGLEEAFGRLHALRVNGLQRRGGTAFA